MKYGLRALVGTCDGIWIATASENSDTGAAGRRDRIGKGIGRVSGCRRRRRRPRPAPRSSSSGGTGSDGPFVPVLSALMSCQRTRKAIDSAS